MLPTKKNKTKKKKKKQKLEKKKKKTQDKRCYACKHIFLLKFF